MKIVSCEIMTAKDQSHYRVDITVEHEAKRKVMTFVTNQGGACEVLVNMLKVADTVIRGTS